MLKEEQVALSALARKTQEEIFRLLEQGQRPSAEELLLALDETPPYMYQSYDELKGVLNAIAKPESVGVESRGERVVAGGSAAGSTGSVENAGGLDGRIPEVSGGVDSAVGGADNRDTVGDGGLGGRRAPVAERTGQPAKDGEQAVRTQREPATGGEREPVGDKVSGKGDKKQAAKGEPTGADVKRTYERREHLGEEPRVEALLNYALLLRVSAVS